MDIGTTIHNPSEDEPAFYLLMSEKGLLCCGGRGR